ncbi:MAG: ATP-binding protein, partial [Candidatus Nanohaloarchaea archaeon]
MPLKNTIHAEPEEKITINVDTYLENIKDRYDSIRDAIQNEAIQNSVDAWDGSSTLSIDIHFDTTEGVLTVEDNAGGMSKRVLKDQWLTLESGDKEIGDKNIGARGQGTAVFLFTAERTVVTTQKNGEKSQGIYVRQTDDGEPHHIGVKEVNQVPFDENGTESKSYRSDYHEFVS